MSEKSTPVHYSVRDGVAVIMLDAPPVNSLSQGMRAAILDAVTLAGSDAAIRGVVLVGAERMFCGGAEIKEFSDGKVAPPDLNDVCAVLEGLNKPVVAAIHGHALGGGMELTLGCHYRVAAPSAKVGFPEVLLGVLPGAGGTQRLPRLIGVARALDMILTGTVISVSRAKADGLIDAVLDGDLLERAIEFTVNAAENPQNMRVAGALPVAANKTTAAQLHEARIEWQKKAPGAKAPQAIVDCIEYAASGASLADGLAFERRKFLDLMNGDQSEALRHLFFAEKAAVKIPGLDADLKARPIAKIGVIGAGTMGGGIAMNFLNAGLPVVLLDIKQEWLDAGIAKISQNYAASVQKGRVTQAEMDARMGLLASSLSYDDVANCDLVIEAVFETMDIKKEVCVRLGKICKPGAIIATNTSTLNVDILADASGRPADFLGMHFFSPAQIMRLLEVVRGAETAPDVLHTVMRLARRIGKIAVVSGVCYGFIGNRMLEGYLREMDFLLMEGASPAQIDRVLESFGMAMGPCRMTDMAGVDVNARVLDEREREGHLPGHPAYRAVVRKLGELGRNGQKNGVGYYRYDGRTPIHDDEVELICIDLATRHNITRRTAIPDEEIRARLLYPLINEGYRILEEGIAYRSGDIDVVWTAGYGFPRLAGGPMHLAQKIGERRIRDRIAEFASVTGDPHGFWDPAPLLTRNAAEQA